MATSKQVVLITGASSGIGEDAALRFVDAGFEVYGVARRVERMQHLVERGVHVFSMDLTDDASIVAGVERILAEQGRLDVLVNNAGYGSYGAVEDVPLDEARRQFEVNLFGLARLSQLVIPHMREQGRGRIINIASIAGKIYTPLAGWYHATKFAVEGLSDAMRVELAPHGIDVVLIEPGPIRTEWNSGARETLVSSSADGAFAAQARRAAAILKTADAPGIGSEPDVVGRKILKAATTRFPAPRYPVGRGAGTVVLARRALPDRVLDLGIRALFR
ncbi:MAG: oxidoreductase [Jatrophihabitans sp.]|uniref:oxidoreductase n=1 Tax=Jatrophihabitans sp. TaxID=1932789 RepID=UPI003F81F864